MKKTYTIPVGNMRPSKKKWWQFWRKNEDSAEKILKDLISSYSGEINFKTFDRKWKIKKIYSLEIDTLLPYKEYWFPNR